MSTPLVNRADWRHSAACCCEDRELFVVPGTRRTMTRWRPSYRRLVYLPAGAAAGSWSRVRLSILDELERRDADGFRRWLAAGARPGGDTARHLATGPGA